MKKSPKISTYLLLVISLLLLVNGCRKKEEEAKEIKDGDGNVYTSVTIGTQVWLDENLKTSKYNDGTNIPLVSDNTQWKDLSSPAYCWYNNDEAAYKDVYGALYNWYAVNTGKLCPAGWHVPTNGEMETLVDYLGGNLVAGGKLKETGTSHWNSPNGGATDQYGFSALPGGYRNYSTSFADIKAYGAWWNITENNATNAYINISHYSDGNLNYNDYVNKKNGYSIRCLKD